jgi:hypothetical protein
MALSLSENCVAPSLPFLTQPNPQNVMNWYHAADGKQAGPFTEEQFRELIASSVVQPATLVWEARLPNWVPLSQVPPEVLSPASSAAAFAGAPPIAGSSGVICAECGKSFAPDEVIRIADRNVCASCKPILVQRLSEGAAPASVAGLWINEEQLLAREYRVEIGTALERAWNLFKNNAGPIIGASLLAGVVFAAGYGVSAMAGLVVPMIDLLIQPLFVGPLTGGLLWYFLRLARGEAAAVGDIFAGFSRCFLQLFLATLVQTLLVVACMIPVGIVAGVGFFALRGQGGGNPFASGAGIGLIIGLVIAGLITLLAIVYLSICWTHSVLLIVDKRMNFWPAMSLSRKMVSKTWGTWGMTLLFLLVAGIISSAGALACLVGLLVTMPLYFAMKVYFYDDNFRDLQPTQT